MDEEEESTERQPLSPRRGVVKELNQFKETAAF